jgi:RNA polymerase sigma-70 factor (ECF subfamily)
MARYAAGDPIAFRRLFAAMAPSVRAFFVRSFRDAAVADDLVQTTFMRLHRSRQSYRPDLPFRPWLFTIAAGVRREELRRRYRLPPHIGEDEWERLDLEMHQNRREPGPDADLVEAVRCALDRLPETQRVVVHLHRYEGMTFEEIARALSTTPGAVRVRASRAYERLREELRALLNKNEPEEAT